MLLDLSIWLGCWLILSVGNYIYNVYYENDWSVNKKVHAWRAFWIGAWSWVGLIFCLAVVIVYAVAFLNDWIETRLCR